MTIRNSIGREFPGSFPGYAAVRPYAGAFSTGPRQPFGAPASLRHRVDPRANKVLAGLDAALDAVQLRDGMAISFHHHLRNGDRVVNAVVEAAARRGVKNLTLLPTALFGVHQALLARIEDGTIGRIEGSLNGPIGRRVSQGAFAAPVILRSHGGRARAIEAGEVKVDVAFIAAPTCDAAGNVSGLGGPAACGPLGYAMTDAMYAHRVVAVTDCLVPFPNPRACIMQTHVDFVVELPSIGDPKGIVSGTTEVTRDPTRLLIAERAAALFDALGLIQEGFSFQTGAGGITLAVTGFVREHMVKRGVKASFVSGGITGAMVDLLEDGLVAALLDVQSFDLQAVGSLDRNPRHLEMSASMYANPHSAACVVDRLDAVVLGATEIDLDFNVNVNTEADGALLHGIGGHQDTAAGARVTVVTAPLTRGRIPLVVDKVLTVTSPGETIDAVVTEWGIAVNPRRQDLLDRLRGSRLPIVPMPALYERAVQLCGKPAPLALTDKIVALIEYRDGTVLDVVRQVAPKAP